MRLTQIDVDAGTNASSAQQNPQAVQERPASDPASICMDQLPANMARISNTAESASNHSGPLTFSVMTSAVVSIATIQDMMIAGTNVLP